MSSNFERIGGEAALRAIISDFIDRVFADVMIGYLFSKIDRAALKELEYQHAAEHLGGPVRYSGRPLGAAHRKHRILGGQFARRKEILRQTLVQHAVAGDIVDAWLAHTEALRGTITNDSDGECND
jgi:hemoglobin